MCSYPGFLVPSVVHEKCPKGAILKLSHDARSIDALYLRPDLVQCRFLVVQLYDYTATSHGHHEQEHESADPNHIR